VDVGLTLAAASKAAAYTLGQLGIGVAIVRRLAGAGHRDRSDADDDALAGWLGRIARAVSILLLAVLLLRLWAQTAAAFGPSEAWSVENLRVIGIESRWGGGWRRQMMAAVALLLSALIVRRRSSPWILFEAAAVAMAVTMPLLGHAGGSAGRHAIHAAHTLGAAAWLGTLGVMVLAAWRWRSVASLDQARLISRFSPIALTAATIVATSGALAAWLYLGSWAALWTTPYGRLLLAKLSVVSLVVVCGWFNWRSVKAGRPPRRGVMTLEWAAALLALGLTGVLTETEHP
jgi:putative copper resistance protein D